jgi:hypothetical protein
MQHEDSNRVDCGTQRCVEEFSLAYEQLNNEAKKLAVEKEDLLAIEEELRFMLHEEIEAKRKRKCVELTRVLNASIRGQ